ncbi:MiaB/RimO family radical SAM methylthiotransferase [Candidatus Woesearchaeota archaeon]|nr:MiaB/RimO family radical SAM methylthiotransferase [Candidatus Woesearchaeota archaeon]
MRVYIKTFGCPSNIYEGEIIENILSEAGHQITIDGDFDAIVINMCSVKGPSVNSAVRLAKQNSDKIVVVSGCIMENEVDKFPDYCGFVHSYCSHLITNAIESVRKGKSVRFFDRPKNLNDRLVPCRASNLISVVPINTGCNGICSYCSVRIVKGKLVSYPKKLVLSRVRSAIDGGTKEVWITSQDVAAYGMDSRSSTKDESDCQDVANADDISINQGLGKNNLVDILSDIVEIPGNFFVRIGMMNLPNLKIIIKNDRNRLFAILNHPKVYKFLHLPLQSGSDHVLKDMNRGYKAHDLLSTINKFRKKIPCLTIATDMICGFPTESDADFESSLSIIEKMKPDVVNISRFWRRPGTVAYDMNQVFSHIIKERSKKMTELFKMISFQNNSEWLGWEGDVLVNEIGKNNSLIGRNISYKPIIIKNKDSDIKQGDLVKVKITQHSVYDLKGTIIEKLN